MGYYERSIADERYEDAVTDLMEEDDLTWDEAVAVLEGRAEDAQINAYEAAMEARADAAADRW